MEILVRDYLDCEYQTLTSEDLDRLSDGDGTSSNKSKAAKQLLGVAKQFGSIGKSVSKRLWSMAKRPKSPPASIAGPYGADGVLCVRIKSRRHQYVDQMLQNYLQCAHSRYGVFFLNTMPSLNILRELLCTNSDLSGIWRIIGTMETAPR